MTLKMRNLSFIALDVLMILAGIVISPIFFMKWRNIGFSISSKAEYGASFEGNSFIILSLFGIVLTIYGVLDLWLFRIKKNRNYE